MTEGGGDATLARIAAALDRLAPPPQTDADLASGPAFHWTGTHLAAITSFRPLPLDLLTGIDEQKQRLHENSQRLANGHAAHDVLLWGSRGMGKSALVKAVAGDLQQSGHNIALVEAGSDQLASLPELFDRLRGSTRSFLLFIDDIGFADDSPEPRLLRSVLEGGAAARPANVRLYVTANRRHVVSRQMSEQDDPVNPRDVLDDKLALSDRFGMRLGFHAASQEDYLAIVARYAEAHDLDFSEEEALLWAKQKGHRSGRAAWQFIVELAGRAGRKLDSD